MILAASFAGTIAFCLGFGTGALAMWAYLAWARLIRTRHEWYSDPKIRDLYPDEADNCLCRPDHDPNWG